MRFRRRNYNKFGKRRVTRRTYGRKKRSRGRSQRGYTVSRGGIRL